MIKTLLTALLCLQLLGCAGMDPVREEDKVFSQVYEAPGFQKDVLYEKVKIWIAQTFKSAKAVLEYENKESGTIIGKGSMPYPCRGLKCIATIGWTVPFTMKVDINDEKFRLTFLDIGLAWPARRDSLGYHEAHEGLMYQQSDFDTVRPLLLGFGEDIKVSLQKNTSAEKW